MSKYILALAWGFALGCWIGVIHNVVERSAGDPWVYVDVHQSGMVVSYHDYPEPTPTSTPIPGGQAPSGNAGVVVAASFGSSQELFISPNAGILAVWGEGSPLAPFAEGLYKEAKLKGVDYRLVVAMAVLESSAGRQACGGNAWGLGSCKGKYGQIQTFDEGYRMVIDNLASPLYAGLTSRQVLCQWVSGDRNCPDAHSNEYATKAQKIMEKLP